MIQKQDLRPYPVMWKHRLLEKTQGPLQEIGAGNAGMQGKSAAAGNNWISAIGVSGGVFGTEDA